MSPTRRKNTAKDTERRCRHDGGRSCKTFMRLRFSTPVRDCRPCGPAHLAAYGEARWHPPAGGFELAEVSFNVRP